MSPHPLSPPEVAAADARPVPTEDAAEAVPVQRVAVPVVPAAHAVPRQVDPVARRLVALQDENAALRARLEQLQQKGA